MKKQSNAKTRSESLSKLCYEVLYSHVYQPKEKRAIADHLERSEANYRKRTARSVKKLKIDL